MPCERAAARKGRVAHARGGNAAPPSGCRRPAGLPAVQLQLVAVWLHKEDGEEFAAAAPGATPLASPPPHAIQPAHFVHRLRAQE